MLQLPKYAYSSYAVTYKLDFSMSAQFFQLSTLFLPENAIDKRNPTPEAGFAIGLIAC